MRIITLDFETYWTSKEYTLSKMGPIQYIRDPRFSAQLLGYCVGNGPVEVVEHDGIADALRSLHLEDPDTVTVAHNGDGFDFLILSEKYGVVPAKTLDTIPLMRWCGLSSVISEGHAALTAALGTGVKYQGTVISDGKRWPDDFTETERAAFKLYCAQDVEQCRANLVKMLTWASHNGFTMDVVTFCSLTSHMATAPALWANGEALKSYQEVLRQQQVKAREELAHLFQFRDEAHMLTCIRSADKFSALLRQLGVEPPMKYSEAYSKTKKAKMEAQGLDTSNEDSWAVYVPALSKQDVDFLAMQDHPDPRVALLCRIRLENNSSIQESRVATFYKMAMYYKPIPVMLKTFGAHTSRYAAGNTEGKSDSLNWQNLSKRNPAMLPLRQAIFTAGGRTLVSCDSSQIEARMLAYIAQQTDVLQLFAQHEDVYADFGQTISGIPAKEIHDGAKSGNAALKKLRNISKTIILGCLGADTEVLTNTGWKHITEVSINDKLWDGETWTNHGGVICSGVKPTVEVNGVRMTEDHRILCGSTWHTARECLNEPQYLALAMSTAAKSCEANAISEPISNESMNLKTCVKNYLPVYDIMNSGSKSRFLIKTTNGALLVHNCGYGTSPNKAAHTMWTAGTHLADSYEEHRQKAEEYVGAYRAKNDAIVRLWRTCGKVLERMTAGQSGTFGGPDGKLLYYGVHTLANNMTVPCIIMPTGFALNYPELHRDEDGKFVFKKKLGRNMVDSHIYGAALVENITQSLAFQLLMWQACRMNEQGLWPCVNIHDSFSVAANDKDAEAVGAIMLECMKMLPSWLQGCPIDAEVEYGKDFTHA